MLSGSHTHTHACAHIQNNPKTGIYSVYLEDAHMNANPFPFVAVASFSEIYLFSF